jgi:hypothetical protein
VTDFDNALADVLSADLQDVAGSESGLKRLARVAQLLAGCETHYRRASVAIGRALSSP